MLEPLAESAPLARAMAPQLCWRDAATGRRCDWYHGLWQDLRLLGLVTAPDDHAVFYARRFADHLADHDAPRILVSGAADYSMLARVLESCGAGADVTVLDVCPTPVHLSRWYAERAGVTIGTVAANVLDYQPHRTFDLVCTHSFLGNFAPANRPLLARRWFEALRPGGRLVLINRVRPDEVASVIGFTERQAAALLERVRAVDAARLATAGLELSALEARVRLYTARFRSHPLRTVGELTGLLAEAGFIVEECEAEPVAGRSAGPATGPTTPGGAVYAKVAARRP